jgi:hypothetical protein
MLGFRVGFCIVEGLDNELFEFGLELFKVVVDYFYF